MLFFNEPQLDYDSNRQYCYQNICQKPAIFRTYFAFSVAVETMSQDDEYESLVVYFERRSMITKQVSTNKEVVEPRTNHKKKRLFW